MNGEDFLKLARILSRGTTEAEWRSAVSRAYYAAFHVARDLLQSCGFNVPGSERAHAYLWLRLSNCGEAGVQVAGSELNNLRGDRNRADYNLDRPLGKLTAASQVQAAEEAIARLALAAREPLKTSVTETIKEYERTILKEVTWS